MKKIIHIGQMKSGTTYIQNALSQNRAKLSKAGFLYPGDLFNQQHACYGLCGSDIPWVSPRDKWNKLSAEMLDEIKKTEKNILISSEALSCMSRKGVENFVLKLGGIDEVIVTVRNLHSVLLSAWQQSVKGGSSKGLPEFFDGLQKDRQYNAGMWKNYSFGEIIKNWEEHSKVTMIIVEMGGRKDKLLEDFLQSCGLPKIPSPVFNSLEENKSLKREDVELLRQFNIYNKFLDKERKESYNRWLLKKCFFPAAEREVGSKIKMPAGYIDIIENWTREELLKIPHTVNIMGNVEDIWKIDGLAIDYDDNKNFDLIERSNEILKLMWGGN